MDRRGAALPKIIIPYDFIIVSKIRNPRVTYELVGYPWSCKNKMTDQKHNEPEQLEQIEEPECTIRPEPAEWLDDEARSDWHDSNAEFNQLQ